MTTTILLSHLRNKEMKEKTEIYTLEQAVINRLREIEAKIAKGKGTWPNSDYVRDYEWDGWIGARNNLRWVLQDAGIDIEIK